MVHDCDARLPETAAETSSAAGAGGRDPEPDRVQLYGKSKKCTADVIADTKSRVASRKR